MCPPYLFVLCNLKHLKKIVTSLHLVTGGMDILTIKSRYISFDTFFLFIYTVHTSRRSHKDGYALNGGCLVFMLVPRWMR